MLASAGFLVKGLLLSLVFILFLWFVTALLTLRKSPQCEATVVVEVLNGCGIKGAAEEVADWLRGKGVDVFSVGNAEDFQYDATIIVDRCEDDSKIDHLAEIIGSDRVVHQVKSSAFVDATIIVGKDLGEWISQDRFDP